jgi:virginiamycin A acetyltransferase
MAQLHMGHRSYGTPLLRGDISNVYVGKFTSIAQGVIMDCGWHHETEFVTTYPLNAFFPELSFIKGHPKTKGDIYIGNDVWIGEGAVIMSGVKIGNGAVIGARSIVTKNVPAYSIYAGNPAAFIRHRFTAKQIDALDRIAWWNWPDEKVIVNGPLLMHKNIDKFIDAHEKTNT